MYHARSFNSGKQGRTYGPSGALPPTAKSPGLSAPRPIFVTIRGDLGQGEIPVDDQRPIGELLGDWAQRYSSTPADDLVVLDVTRGPRLDRADTLNHPDLGTGTVLRLVGLPKAMVVLGPEVTDDPESAQDGVASNGRPDRVIPVVETPDLLAHRAGIQPAASGIPPPPRPGRPTPPVRSVAMNSPALAALARNNRL